MAIPTELATAYVSIIPSARNLAQNIGRELAPVTGLAAVQGKQAGAALGGQFTQGFAASGALARFKTEAKGIGKQVSSSLSGFGLAGGLGAAFLTKQAVTAASDLAESQSKVNVVFKAGAPLVDQWSESAARGLGISQQAALEAAGTFGNFLISMGLVPKAAQEMSTELVGLASDLASFNNTSPEEALLAIRSGLAGEIEPLRRYGVALSAARLETEAAAQGINKTSAEMSAAEKATLSYAIIMEDTALAQGDFARTSGGLANQQRILAAELKDAQAQLGQFLVPILLAGAKAVTALGKGLGILNDVTDGWAARLAGTAVVAGGTFLAAAKIGQVVGRLGTVFRAEELAINAVSAAQTANIGVTQGAAAAQGGLAASTATATAAMQGQSAAARILGTSIKPLPGLLAAAAVGFIGGKKAGEELNKLVTGTIPTVDEFTASLLRLQKGQTEAFDFSGIAKDLKGQITATNGALRSPLQFGRSIGDFFTGGEARRAKAEIGPINDALKSILQTEGVDAATRAYGLLTIGLRDQGVAADQLTSAFAPFRAALDLAGIKATEVTGKTDDLAGSFAKLADGFAVDLAVGDIADQLDATKTAFEELEELKRDARGEGRRSQQAAEAEERAVESLSDAYDSQGKAAESLAEAKAKLADFDSPDDRRIRELELLNIQGRVVETPEEARSKEIDLLKFSEDTAERRADLQRGVASAEEAVITATDRVGDAQEAVSEASAARRLVQVEAAQAIAGAERRAKEAFLAAGTAILKAKDDQLIGNDALAVYLGLLDGMAERFGPSSPLSTRLDGFLEKLKVANLLEGHLGPKGPLGPPAFQLPPLGPAGPVGSFSAPPPAKPTLDYHPQVTVVAPDQPSRQTLDTLNRKQAIRLASSRALT